MLTKITQWIKNNKFAFILIVVLVVIVVGNNNPVMLNRGYSTKKLSAGSAEGFSAMMGQPAEMTMSYGQDAVDTFMPIVPAPDYPAIAETADRKVVKGAQMSLQVENVSNTIDSIKTKVSELKGYLVNVNLNKPEFGENATLSVRVPTESLEELLAFTRQNSVKVVNENISGTDITDQYVDTETRLTQLKGQLARLEEILRLATTVEDIMKVQPYIENLQSQIESLEGQNRYADASSKVSLVTIYLSTDELSLPYTPDLAWRPQAVFKNATRSLLLTLQQIGSAAIWLGVYSVLIVPALTIVFIALMWHKRSAKQVS